MAAHALVATLVTALVTGALSSLVPFISIDLFLIGVALAEGPDLALAACVLAAAGQVVGKLPIYYASRGVTGLAADRAGRFRSWIARWQKTPHVVLAASAVFGLPPFSIAATLAGVLAIRVVTFGAVIFAGRLLRFVAVVAITACAIR